MLISFLFLHENICCGYSLEAPHRGASNEYPQHMFLWRNKKKIMWIPPLICSYGPNIYGKYVSIKSTKPLQTDFTECPVTYSRTCDDVNWSRWVGIRLIVTSIVHLKKDWLDRLHYSLITGIFIYILVGKFSLLAMFIKKELAILVCDL